MKDLLIKDWKLALHPTVPLFWLLSAMLLIPNYPYYVVLFYNLLGIFFICLTGRENSDLYYTLTLPIRKRDLVRSRVLFSVLLQLVQLAVCVPFAVLRQSFPMPGNSVGMDAGLGFFAFAFLLLGVYNFTFFPAYYRAPDKVGKVFAFASVGFFALILLAEAAAHAVPFVRDVLDTADSLYINEKLCALAVGVAAYAGMSLAACRRAERVFDKIDL